MTAAAASTASAPPLPMPRGSTSSFSLGAALLPPESAAGGLPTASTVPLLRETVYCESINSRSRFLDTLPTKNLLGPPDLVHRGRNCGVRSAEYTNNDFLSRADEARLTEGDDGYAGVYHFVNGMSFEEFETSMEQHMCKFAGIVRRGQDFVFEDENLSLHSNKRDLVLTYCTFNIFDRLDFRAKMLVRAVKSHARSPIKIDKSYVIIPSSAVEKRSKRHIPYSERTIRSIPSEYWEELKASQIVRTFMHLDLPRLQLPGLVTFASYISSKKAILSSVATLVKNLDKGHLCGASPVFGNGSSSGLKLEPENASTQYRNYLCQALIRACQLDMSGECSAFAVSAIRDLYNKGNATGPWDYVIIQILKTQYGTNNELAILTLIRDSVAANALFSTQLALLLQQQAKFLISKGAFSEARLVAKKCATILPLDFDCRTTLVLCHILLKDHEQALILLNSMPVVMHERLHRSQEYSVCGVNDAFSATFVDRLASHKQHVMSESCFATTFPPPAKTTTSKKKKTLVPLGSIHKMWHDLFVFYPEWRHPVCGNVFAQLPLLNCSSRELSSVDLALIQLCGPSSYKAVLTERSANDAGYTILDFRSSSTWGRCYDIVSFMVACAGWDTIVGVKNRVLQRTEKGESGDEYIVNHKSDKHGQYVCQDWIEQLFAVVFQDLKKMTSITDESNLREHSALEWEMIGLLGWLAKYSLKESVSSLVTSVVGNASQGKFDYFGTVACLEIYDEFILTGFHDSRTDVFHDDYSLAFKSNKLLVNVSGLSVENLASSLESRYLSLDFILLSLLKLASWNLRWYQYAPNYLVTRILQKLILRYDHVYVLAQMQIVLEQNKQAAAKPKSFMGLWASSKPTGEYEFVASDTILDYMRSIIQWIESINRPILDV